MSLRVVIRALLAIWALGGIYVVVFTARHAYRIRQQQARQLMWWAARELHRAGFSPAESAIRSRALSRRCYPIGARGTAFAIGTGVLLILFWWLVPIVEPLLRGRLASYIAAETERTRGER